MLQALLQSVAALVCALAAYVVYASFIATRFSPLRALPSPPLKSIFDNHLGPLLDPSRSSRSHEILAREYGRSVRIRGIGPWDERFFTLDPLSISHVLKNTAIYEKPWTSRRIIQALIGCGLLAAEGTAHRRQRRVVTPAFSVSNMRALIPLVFGKGKQLRDKWLEITHKESLESGTVGFKIDVAQWVSRATFDIIGLAGFDYDFNAIQDETNELFVAYKDMFETSLAQDQGIRSLISAFTSVLDVLFPTETTKLVARCQATIERIAGKLIQEKKARVAESNKGGIGMADKDLLTLLLKANIATDLPPNQRISDQDILNNINTFMFAGSDTTSLAVTWTLFLLAKHPDVQTRLRQEILSALPSKYDDFDEEEIESLYTAISELPYLENVTRETLRLIPPVHSSLRAAVQDDTIPTSYPVTMRRRDGSIVDTGQRSVFIPKGTLVHIPIEAYNLDKEIWGSDAWEFHPDRWDHLPEAAQGLPGLFSNTLTFSAGPRSCVGMRFSLVEIKTFIAILLAGFTFSPSEEKVLTANVVLTRPYVAGQFAKGSQCPLIVKPYERGIQPFP